MLPDSCDRVVVSKDGLVAVSEVEAPDLDVLVCAACDQEGGVAGDVHGRRGELVAVHGQEELEGVDEKDLDGRVELRDGDEAAVRAEADGQSVLFQLQAPLVDHAQLLLRAGCACERW